MRREKDKFEIATNKGTSELFGFRPGSLAQKKKNNKKRKKTPATTAPTPVGTNLGGTKHGSQARGLDKIHVTKAGEEG